MEHKEIYNAIEGSKFYKKLLKDKENAEKTLKELDRGILEWLNKQDYEEVAKLAVRANGWREAIDVIEDMIDDFEWEFNKEQE